MKGLFISVRTASTRLPKKALKKIDGKTTIEYLMDRVKTSKYADKIVLCTTRLREDDVLCDLARKNNIVYYRGSAPDKLMRWFGAAKEYDIDFFVNADGDDIFYDAGLADLCFETYFSTECDFVDGHGFYNDVYGIRTSALEEVVDIKGTKETEFIRPYFVDTGRFKVERLRNVPDYYKKNKARMTLDYEEDFLFFEAVIIALKEQDKSLSFANILIYLEENPEVIKLNYHLEEAWKVNQSNLTKLILKEEK